MSPNHWQAQYKAQENALPWPLPQARAPKNPLASIAPPCFVVRHIWTFSSTSIPIVANIRTCLQELKFNVCSGVSPKENRDTHEFTSQIVHSWNIYYIPFGINESSDPKSLCLTFFDQLYQDYCLGIHPWSWKESRITTNSLDLRSPIALYSLTPPLLKASTVTFARLGLYSITMSNTIGKSYRHAYFGESFFWAWK